MEIEEIEAFDEEIEDEDLMLPMLPNRVLTPMGYIPDDFNFWLGHTDFRLTTQMRNQIEEVDGVETIEIYTPYRFRLGIGMMFDEDEVKRNIQRAIGVKKQPLSNDIQEEIVKLKNNINKSYWAFYIAPNGESEMFQSDNMEEVYKKLEIYEKSQKLVGGHVEYYKTSV